MRVLLIHTSGLKGSLALADTKSLPPVLATAMLPPRTFSERLMPALLGMLNDTGSDVGAIHAVGVVSGPGSFTGVRTGLSVAKGLCEAREIPLVTVSRLALLAGNAGLVHAMLDAGRGEFYYGRYRNGTREIEALVTREQMLEAIGAGGRSVACEAKVIEALAGENVEQVREPVAADALGLVLEGVEAGRNDVLEDANYLRRSDGEIFAKPMAGRVVE